jgi:hypothetical protein
MRNEFDPMEDLWYWHRDKGQLFQVIAIDQVSQTIEVQHFDGDIEEFSLLEWRDLALERGEEPENWLGAFDISETDDLGTGVTDTTAADWQQPLTEFHEGQGADVEVEFAVDEYREGTMPTVTLSPDIASEATEADKLDMPPVCQRIDGVFEETFNEVWSAEYAEDETNGLWRVDIFKEEVPEWQALDFDSLEAAREAAQDCYNQLY